MTNGSTPQASYPPQANQPPTYATGPPAGQWGAAPAHPGSGWGARGPKIKSYWTVFVFALIAMILCALSIGLSWQTGSETFDGTTITVNYYITQTGCSSSSSGGSTCTALTSNVPGGYYAAEALIIVGLVLAILLVVFAILGALGLVLKGLQARLLLLFGILSIPITLAAPFAFLGTSYNNSNSDPGLFVSPWTAGAGWYCAIVAGVLLIIFLLLARKTLAEQRAAVAAGPMMGGAMAPATAPMYGTSSYGSAPMGAPAPAPAPMGAPPNCPKCGQPAVYIAQYQRYYCYTDQTYV
jgi:hypothetical protein